MKSRDRFLAACVCQPLERPPVWVMRQAGRYLPEYRALKEKYSFLDMVKAPEMATEVTLQPLKRFNLDAAIIFSDILVIPEAMGQSYYFDEGIQMEYTLDSESKIEALNVKDIPERLSYVGKAIELIRQAVGDEKAVLGFGGSPWTLATYMTEGGSSKNFSKIKALAYQSPAAFERLMEKLTEALIHYFKMKIEAGVDAIQIFDSWAALCPADQYWELSLKWIQKIIQGLPADFPIIVYGKNMAHRHEDLLKTGAQVLGADWTVSLPDLRKSVPDNFALQGNLDPTLLSTSPEIVRQAAENLLTQMAPYRGHILNLGHGIHPDAKIENMEALVQSVVEFSSKASV